jgi:hypothetical protein
MIARIHPGRPAQIAVAAFLLLAFSQPAISQLSNQAVGGKYAGHAGVEPSTTQVSSSTTGAISIQQSYSDFGSDNYAHTAIFGAVDSPAYGVSSYVAGVGSSYASFYKHLTYTAEASGTYSLSTFLEAGSVDVTLAGGAVGNGSAGFDWNLLVNGESVAAVTVSAQFNPTGVSSFNSASPTTLTDYLEHVGLAGEGLLATWGATTLSNVWQGFLNTGESVELDFYATSVAYGNFTDVNSAFGFGCYGNILTVSGETACGSATVSFGDPAIFSSPQGGIRNLAYLSDTVFDFTPTTAVPEPGEWAMMLAGLGTIGLMARRRRKLTANP